MIGRLFVAVVVVALVVSGFFYGRWEWRECRHVGHSSAYCWTHANGDHR